LQIPNSRPKPDHNWADIYSSKLEEGEVMNEYQQYIHLSRYARWIDEKNRRETWEETVTRYCDFFEKKYPEKFPYKRIFKAIYNLEVMPSMRALMSAGKALERDHMAGYNCSFVAVDNQRVFDEIMFILMCGTGVGFSVERQFVANLPVVAEDFHHTDTCITVPDNKIGWATSLRELVSLLYAGRIPKWDLSKLRAAGARLKTFGGRSSGPAPLDELFHFTVALFQRAAGRRLTSLECHDLICKIADVVVVGGVRRSALISLSNLTDERMRGAKNGSWWDTEGQRALANNSAAYTEKPDIGIFMKEWLSLYESKSGERGIFNRVSAIKKARENGRREFEGHHFGTNPCGEIILRPNGLCNLTEIVVRESDTVETLREKVEIATIMGTFQSTLTDFRYVRSIWKKNAEEERLLGVSMTGIMDNALLSGATTEDLGKTLTELKDHAISVNKKWAEKLGINPSAAITTVKPSGTVSQLVDSASGIHPRYSNHYIRTVRADKTDPLATLMKDAGVPVEDDVTKPHNTYVFAFPQKAPEHSVMRNDMSAIEQLEHYLTFQKFWCEHNPSITVYVREHEWLAVGAWVYKNFDHIGGVSFLPHSDHAYKQAPYQECTEEEYHKLVAAMPSIDWSKLSVYEKTDSTTGNQELACTSGVCELV
jgi:ribonucleoside-diphosphate reductase alpha chain